MFAQSLVFLRFACYVHNPDAIYTRNSKSVRDWLLSVQEEDPEWSFEIPDSLSQPISIDVPSSLHQVLLDFDANYTYSQIRPFTARSILVAKKNSFQLTMDNIRRFIKATRTTPAQLVTVLESYLNRIEVNPVQPVSDAEIKAIKNLGVAWDLAARLPRMDERGFDKVYIVDEHHRVKCL